MHIVTLEIKDSMYEHFLYLIKNLNSKEITVVKESLSDTHIPLKQELHKLFDEAGIDAFKEIKDPVAWQRKQRDEW
ncbi:MAG TPA: hypothetical protein EYG98_04595 [Sulfurovum sp.]|nr:hypothetical protein [Sulfurovum sp.]